MKNKEIESEKCVTFAAELTQELWLDSGGVDEDLATHVILKLFELKISQTLMLQLKHPSSRRGLQCPCLPQAIMKHKKSLDWFTLNNT